ncbi:hypothetical protein CSC94_20175 [Zhengella mangrovi]|uniref:Membrane-anchored protein n=1 Tax=Zhengella mangrovi TaxID=1982044 RepID=A0A2G1QIE9_9HYPH|nr:hypothetical protein [Zhengella mangrovi]PHP65230.1 hypothetical protein CSC94_20175 [Zhengella mangrovi]
MYDKVHSGPATGHATSTAATVTKIAEVTLAFWVMKIIATTLGETTGDFIAQTLNLGYVAGLGITGALLVAVIFFQVRASHFHPALFWAAIVATTTAGTEISDMMDRTLGLGYASGSVILTAGLLATLAVWYWRDGNLSVDPIRRRDAEITFWIAVVFSNSLGTAFGDFLVDNAGLGYVEAALVCTAVIGLVLTLHYTRAMNDIALFWIAFIFTRPFGATFGDFLTKPVSHGGLDLGTYNASLVCLVLMTGIVLASVRNHRRQQATIGATRPLESEN